MEQNDGARIGLDMQLENGTQNMRYYAHHPEEITRRLEELDREWDIERSLEAHAAAIRVAGEILRSQGVRTRQEIRFEKQLLESLQRSLRGDYLQQNQRRQDQLPPPFLDIIV